MTVEIPNWCMIGKTIEWYNPDLVVFANDNPWFMEKIIAYGLDGFFINGKITLCIFLSLMNMEKQLERLYLLKKENKSYGKTKGFGVSPFTNMIYI